MTDRSETLLRELTLDEKIVLLAGADTWHTHAIPRLGIPALKVSDGPNGVRGEQKDTRSQTSASFPAGVAMGATWNPDLVYRIGQALAEECKTKGAHVLLGPTVNLHRHPLAGRNFECFAEDPYLLARMAVAYISGLQSQGVGACVKHFVCNDQEFERFTISAEVDERTLHEIYLPPFKAAVQEAGVWTLMTAYNRVNGTYVSENDYLLRDILKGAWGYDGLVMSDWYGTYSDRVPSGGLDLEMPGPGRWMAPDKVREVLRCGDLTEEQINDKVRRLLRTLERVGALEHPEPVAERSVDHPAHRELIRRAGAEAIVLLKNDAGLLPIRPGHVRRVAIIGRPAAHVAFQGGGSAEVHPHYVVQPLDAIRQRYGQEVEIVHAPGPSLHRFFPLLDPAGLCAADGTPGKVTVQQYANTELAGDPDKEFLAAGSELAWFGMQTPELDLQHFSVRLTGSWTPPADGVYTFSLAAVGRARWWFGGEKRLDWWAEYDLEPPANFNGIAMPWKEARVALALEAGRTYPFIVEFASPAAGRWRAVRLGCLPPEPADPIAEAEAVAAAADVAVVFAGLTPEWESEGQDRESLSLPAAQDELIARVAAANPNTVVVLNVGSPVVMPWLDRVKAVLQMWYLGQEAGNAIADVLFGAADPGGRLPTTFPRRIQDTPAYINYPGENGRVRYGEGLFVGYRYYDKRDLAPLFPFGHGLSYTDFAYSNLRLSADVLTPDDLLTLSVDVRNTGDRPGSDVVQVYVRDVASRLVRPEKELKAFAKVHLQPGQTQTVTLTLDRQALAYYDPAAAGWVVEPGEFEVLVGRSAADIRLRARFVVG